LFGARAEYLSARLLTTVFSRGDDWPGIPRVYQISLLNFTFDSVVRSAVNMYQIKYIDLLSAAEGGIMEAKKTLDKISSDWILWKRELDREVTGRDRNTELHYAEKKASIPAATIAQCTGLTEDEINTL
jgi:hypothetical protein